MTALPSCPDPLVFAYLSKLSDRVVPDIHLLFRKSNLNKWRREGLEYETRGPLGYNRKLLRDSSGDRTATLKLPT